ncbi:VOC family protein [Pseudorhodoferax sp.]|uniref:VOC family protein n=1 Tax=Pseudorhodoferax sp. TaxID=1993553 RepID=UPI0039E4EA81
MSIAAFDHVAVPCRRPREMMYFYRALGFRTPEPEAWLARDEESFAVHFGANKINFHMPLRWENPAFTLRGPTAVPACGDFCFVWNGTQDALIETLKSANAHIEEGPVKRVGARGDGTSIYIRDPDGNLLEFIVYAGAPAQ